MIMTIVPFEEYVKDKYTNHEQYITMKKHNQVVQQGNGQL